jgi:hypothetical protein
LHELSKVTAKFAVGDEYNVRDLGCGPWAFNFGVQNSVGFVSRGCHHCAIRAQLLDDSLDDGVGASKANQIAELCYSQDRMEQLW